MTFHERLNVIGSFRETAQTDLYTPLPDDWHLAVADIRGSTEAIRLGKYKEVNMAGASVIAALNNLVGEHGMLPYLFGGDGAVIAIPGEAHERARGIIAYCRDAVKGAFGLELAAGVIPMTEIRANGHDVAAARLRISESIDQTVFWGSGVTWVEDQVKAQDLLGDVIPIEADFSGLECRWSQIPSAQDEIVAYIIQANGASETENVQIYDDCFDAINRIYGSESEFHPVSESALELTFKPDMLRVEWALRSHGRNVVGKLVYAARLFFEVLAGHFLMKHGYKTEETDWSRYRSDLIRHVDYRKFGDALCFVATGTVGQRMEMHEYLETGFKHRRLAYGLHPSFAAMLTCYVKSYQRNHVHFVDGSDGGYAKASQELKMRCKTLESQVLGSVTPF